MISHEYKLIAVDKNTKLHIKKIKNYKKLKSEADALNKSDYFTIRIYEIATYSDGKTEVVTEIKVK